MITTNDICEMTGTTYTEEQVAKAQADAAAETRNRTRTEQIKAEADLVTVIFPGSPAADVVEAAAADRAASAAMKDAKDELIRRDGSLAHPDDGWDAYRQQRAALEPLLKACVRTRIAYATAIEAHYPEVWNRPINGNHGEACRAAAMFRGAIAGQPLSRSVYSSSLGHQVLEPLRRHPLTGQSLTEFERAAMPAAWEAAA